MTIILAIQKQRANYILITSNARNQDHCLAFYSKVQVDGLAYGFRMA